MIYNTEEAAAKLNIPENSLKKHVNNFLHEFKQNLPEFKKVALTDDYEKIYFQFHKLKSTLRMISAVEATEICQEACDKSHDKLSSDYINHMERIVDSLHQIEIIVQQ